MKLTNYEVKNSTVTANVDFTKEEIASHFQSLYKEYASSIAIQGFRKGKAPLNLVKKHVNSTHFYEDILYRLAENAIVFLLREKKEDYVEYPKVDYKDVPVENEPFTVTLQAELYPTVTLPDLSTLSVKAEKPPSEEDLYKNKMDQFLNIHATWEPIEGSPEIGNYAIIEYSQVPEGKTPADIKEPGNMSVIELGKNTLFPDSDDKIMKLSPGEFTIIDYKTSVKELQFKVQVISYKNKIVPSLDQSLLEKINHDENLEDLQNRLQSEAKQEVEKRKDENQLMAIFTHLQEKINLEKIPDSLLKSYVDMELSEYKEQLDKSQITMDAFLESNHLDMDEFKKQLEPKAKEHIKVDMLIRQIYKDHPEISIKDSDVHGKMDEFLGTYTKEEQKKINMQHIENLVRDNLIRQSVIALLKDTVKVSFSDVSKH
ncbi:MAG: trigger factor [Caldisericia bacterium]|nr:trigger factor [Caldisericia bacterium]MDD4613974.1 trigger factor [Caldisericia bacterium]